MSELSPNPLLSALKLPGRVFPVPSGCHFYNNGEVDDAAKKTGEVQVFSMSGLAEMKFRSPDLLYSGKAVCEVIKECIPSILKPEVIMSKDVDTLLSYIRLVTYGQTIEIRSKHSCENAKEHTYDVNLESMVTSTKVLTKEQYQLMFTVKLPNDQVVQLHPLEWQDAVELLQAASSSETTGEEVNKLFTKNILSLISSIDGISDREMISQWVKLAPAPYVKLIQDAVNNGLENWGTDFMANIKCKDCGEEYIFPLDLNPASFFSQ